jgi:TetR/AcrR family transcriptional regulator, tetracycline repressor protein
VSATSGRDGRAPTTLSRDALVEVAVTIAQSEGLSALTIRRLADATGKAPMTLYSHVPNKEALLVLVADTLLARIEIPQGRWDRAFGSLCLSTWRTLGDAPGLATYIWKHVPYFFTGEGLRLADGAIGLLIAGGFSPVDASRALEALMTYITGDVQRREAWAANPRARLGSKVKGYSNLEAVSAGQAAGRQRKTDSEKQFTYGLELLLEGLRRDARRRPKGDNQRRQQRGAS